VVVGGGAMEGQRKAERGRTSEHPNKQQARTHTNTQTPASSTSAWILFTTHEAARAFKRAEKSAGGDQVCGV
jgi:uroporphyrinogen-III synthase